MDKKYEFTDETKEIDGRILHRIVAVKDFYYGDRISIVRKGDLGGFIESEDNLSHDGGSWVMNNAWVYGNAQVFGNAWVYGNARVYGNAQVFGNARVYGDAWVSGNAQVYGDAWVSGNAWVYGNAQVFGNAWEYGDAQVFGNARVSENAHICENAAISSNDDYAVVSGFGSENRTTTFFLLSNKKVLVSCGCFIGYLDEFRAKVLETHGGTPLGQEYLMIADLMEMRFKRVLENK